MDGKMEITESEFLKHPKKYLDYSKGDLQVTILDATGKPWIILGRGPQTPVTPAEVKAHEDSIQAFLDEAGDDLPEPTGSWFD